jgi:hypothetical protein
LQAQAAPVEQARTVASERQQIGTRLADIENERTQARADALGVPQAMIGQREPIRPAEVPTFQARERPDLPQPEQLKQTLAAPDHEQALQADINRERVADVSRQIPVDVDSKGNLVYRSLDEMAEEAEAYRRAADELTACVTGGALEAA